MNRYQIFLSGGMSNLSFNEQNTWRKEIKDKLENYDCDFKVKCINPVEYYNTFNEGMYDSDLEVMNFDLHRLKTSNLIIVDFNDKKSIGTNMEIAIAHENEIPILGLVSSEHDLHPWQYAMCSKVFTDMEALIEYIKIYYLD
jgi:hypothetical protein